MKTYPTRQIRNVVLLGHSGSGKSTILEAMAFNAKMTDRMGRIEDGNTLSDFNQEEIQRQISISTSIVPIEFKDHKLNIFDVPGYFDFVGELVSAVNVANCAVIVIDCLSGLEVGAIKAWEYVQAKKIPTFILVNKMDRDNAQFETVMEQIKNTLGPKAVPFEIPYGEGEGFKGVLNAVDMTGRERSGNCCIDIELPPETLNSISPYREMIVESVAQSTEELMDKYFNGEELTNEEIHKGLRKGVLEGELVPILCASGHLNVGVETLANMIIGFFPSPEDIQKERKISSEAPASAFIFKTIVDPYVGRLSQFKAISGTIKSGMELLNTRTNKKEKISHLYVLQGKKQIEVDKLEAGDIGAFSKLSDTTTGDTLSDPKEPVNYKSIEFPKPNLSMAIEPKTKGDEDKIGVGLQRLQEEDPTIKVYRNDETKQTIISGMGEMHLEIIQEKMKNKFGVDILLKDPQIPYRETIKKKATAEGKHKKQSGGRGQFGHVLVDFEPIGTTDIEYEFVDKVVGGAVPRNFIPAVDKGLQECRKEGVLAGFPVVGLKATLHDGSYHSVDSDEMSFKMAASLSYKKGMKAANPVLLEPIYKVQITVPDQYMGDVIGDINKKRGHVLGMEPADKGQKIVAEAPLAEMFKYATELRSLTQARGEFEMEFERYEEVPANIAEKVIEKAAESAK
ncbi:elongation factor G [Alkalibaculum bacchi]|uniref:elongation factor G n=1 Tax=Alkalibaculum bacchi TaxID=645887 RepID=UPI0026EF1560|nr:elongation factor G [Alkalibaculum bacchi]